MPRRVELLPRAVRDLEALPLRLQEEVVAKMELLRDFPELGAPMLDAFQGYRSLLAVRRTYRIVYRVESTSRVVVAYVRHCARRPPRRGK